MAVAGKLHISKVVSRVFQFRHHFSKLNTNCSRTLFTFRRQLFDCRIKQSQFQKFHTAAGPNNKLSEKMSATTLNQSLSPMDPSSFSRPDLAYVKHYNLAVNVNFNSRTLDCTATLNVHLNEGIKELILDTSNLNIRSIAFPDGTDVKYTLDKEVPNFGSKLTLKFPDETVPQQSIIIIKYSTSPKASALQWLDPEQTSGKKYPYLFSQCQPIHARSILPCQDTPAIKFTYEAEVTAPEEYTVLMSALRGDVDKNKTVFKQPVPIPSYLLAIAVGVLESRTLGPRSTVWAESAEIEASQSEFSDTEKYLEAAERLCGRYQWSRYDLLVLPPSFPYGGMENPCLTFVTPTLLAGDKSQADVIIHEIMHSWTGNLVTNKNFEHFWLNEGFTVFLERKVAASLIDDPSEGMRSRDFHSLLGLQELTEAVQTLGESSPLTQLVPNLKGIHPDDAFSRVPYEKGSLFLRYLEDLAGGPMIFDDFIREYIRKFQRDSLDTEQFKSFLMDYFNKNESILNVDWYAWLHTSGMPPVIPSYDKSMTRAVTDLATKLCDESSLHGIFFDDVKHFTPHQMINLLQELIERPPVPLHILHQMGESYRLKVSKNSEIIYRWHRLCIRSRDLESVDDVLQFLNTQGRMKYVRPIYRDLYEWEGPVRERAISNFLENEKYMMHVSAYTLRKDLHLD